MLPSLDALRRICRPQMLSCTKYCVPSLLPGTEMNFLYPPISLLKLLSLRVPTPYFDVLILAASGASQRFCPAWACVQNLCFNCAQSMLHDALERFCAFFECHTNCRKVVTHSMGLILWPSWMQSSSVGFLGN